MNSSLPSVVIYHGKCADGTTAAAVVYYVAKQQGRNPNETIRWIPGDNSAKQLPDNLKSTDDVLILDFSFSLELVEKLKSQVAQVRILDHHASAERELGHLPYAFFDQERSGAGIAWDVFMNGKQRPKVIDHIEDRDIWRWSDPHSEAFCLGFDSMCTKFEDIIPLFEERQLYLITLEQGEALLKTFNSQVDTLCKNSCVCTMTIQSKDYKVAVANVSLYSHVSKVGNQLCEMYPETDFAVVWHYSYKHNGYRVSLRGKGKVDLSKLASVFNGGGHPNASGFTLKKTSVHDHLKFN